MIHPDNLFMRGVLLGALCLLLSANSAFAKAYGHYNLERLVRVKEEKSGEKYHFQVDYFDRMLKDLADHGGGYPPKFDSTEDRRRAEKDVLGLTKVLEILINGSEQGSPLLRRAGLLYSIGYNLDLPGFGEKTTAMYMRLFKEDPNDSQGNYQYGAFLAGAGRAIEALPYLEKALDAGIVETYYTLGLVHLTLGDRKKALKYLEEFQRRRPKQEELTPLIESIRSGNVQIESEVQ